MNSGGSAASRTGAARTWLRLFWISAFLTLITAASLAPHLRDSAELVRMRNALLLQSEPAVHDWTPASIPAGFAIETTPPIPLYAEVVERNALHVDGDDWATALAIGRHLLPEGKRSGGAIQADLTETYARITGQGEGYCGDFADSFTGLATAAGIFSRPWAFSFDGFGGRGHIFNEVWNSQNSRWIMIDVFNNFYVTGAEGRPLSAMEFRAALSDPAAEVNVVAVDAASAPGFKHEDKLLAYYRRGLPQWYMWWGNNVFEYDQSALVRTLGDTHRALEQLGGVAAGVHPQIRIVELAENQPEREAMQRLRIRLFTALVLGIVSVLLLSVLIVRRLGGRAP